MRGERGEGVEKNSVCTALFLIKYIIQITFQNSLGAFNVTNFNWKANDFCKGFKGLKLAQDFLNVWEMATTYSPGMFH